MNDFKLITAEYANDNKEILCNLPVFHPKYKEQLCVGSHKYSYDDLSKVYVDFRENLHDIIPKCTAKSIDETVVELDFAPLYIIGMLEMLYLTTVEDNKGVSAIVSRFTHCLNIYDTYEELTEVMRTFNDTENHEEERKLLNLLITMRKSYQSIGHGVLLDLVPSVFLIWYKDKKKFWQMFFEVMQFCLPIFPKLLEPVYKNEQADKFDALLNEALKIQNSIHKIQGNFPFDIKISISEASGLQSVQRYVNECISFFTNALSYIKKNKRNKDMPKKVVSSTIKSFDRALKMCERLKCDLDLLYGIDLEWMPSEAVKCRAIQYTVPETEPKQKHKITDCRGISIYLCVLLFLRLLNDNHAESESQSYFFDYWDIDYSYYARDVISDCIGDDLQAEVLSGKILGEQFHRSIRGSVAYKHIPSYTISDSRIRRDYFEDNLLFRRMYKLSDRYSIAQVDRDVNVSYVDPAEIHKAFGYILLCSPELAKIDVKEYETQIDALKARLEKSDRILSEERQKVKELQGNSLLVSDYESKIKTLEKALSNKTDIISKLTEENKQLNADLANIYSDDETVDSDSDNLETQVSLETAIDYLNNFSFLLIGGRLDIVGKLKDLGISEVCREDNPNKIVQTGGGVLADFVVVNTKFVSHKAVRAMEKFYSKDIVIYYNGTNTESLVMACYDFAKKYLES